MIKLTKIINEIVVKPTTPFKFNIGDTVYNEADEKGVVIYREPNWEALKSAISDKSNPVYQMYLDLYYHLEPRPHTPTKQEKARPFYIVRFDLTHPDGPDFSLKVAPQEYLWPPFEEEVNEIIVKPSSSPVPLEVRNQIDHIIANQLPKDIQHQREEIGDPFTILNDKGENMVFDFVRDHMIASHYEILKGGQEMLVSHSNRRLVNEDDILEYLEENPGLKRYLDNLIWKYCMETVDIDAIKEAAYKRYVDSVENSKWLPHPDEWFLNGFRHQVQDRGLLEPFVDFYDAVWDPEFLIYLYSALLKSDLP